MSKSKIEKGKRYTFEMIEKPGEYCMGNLVPYSPTTVTKTQWRLGQDFLAFQVFRDSKGEWRWRVLYRNGEVSFVSSEGYRSMRRAVNGFHSIMRVADCFQKNHVSFHLFT